MKTKHHHQTRPKYYRMSILALFVGALILTIVLDYATETMMRDLIEALQMKGLKE